MDSHIEDTVASNLVLRNIGRHMNVQTPGPGASKGFLPAVWGGGGYVRKTAGGPRRCAAISEGQWDPKGCSKRGLEGVYVYTDFFWIQD